MIYKNQHGDEFSFLSYRTDINTKNGSLSKQVSKEKAQHGEFVAISGKGSRFHVLFNQSKGIAAGEYLRSKIADRVKEGVNNLVYVEHDSDAQQTIIIIISNGKIVTDLIHADEGIEHLEFEIALQQIDSDVDLVVNGLDEKEVVQYLYQHRKNILSIHDDVGFIFSQKVEGSHLTLMPSSQALKGYTTGSSKNILYGVVIVLIAAGFYYDYSEQEKKKEQLKNAAKVNPYAQYKAEISALTVPAETLGNAFQLAFKAIGLGSAWEFTEITVSGGTFTIKFAEQGADLTEIESEFKSFPDAKVKLTGSDVVLTGSIAATNRNFPYVIYPIKEVEHLMYKTLVLDYDYKVRTESEVDNTVYLVKKFNLTIDNGDASDFENISAFFKDKPVIVNSITIKPDPLGFQLNVNFSIFGAKR